MPRNFLRGAGCTFSRTPISFVPVDLSSSRQLTDATHKTEKCVWEKRNKVTIACFNYATSPQ